MIVLTQLEHLIAVAQYGTLSKAAEILHISQPVLSRSMQKLEDELQVQLFHRQKNRIALNQSGITAVECARRVLTEAQHMIYQVREFDRSQHMILIGSCAPAPLWFLLPLAAQLYPEMTIASELKNDAVLFDGLENGTYRLIVLTEEINIQEHPEFYCQRYGEENLCLALPPNHLLSNRTDGVYLKEIDGERMLLYTDIGFWKDWSQKMLPSTYFLLQQNLEDFSELVAASDLPAFSSDLGLQKNLYDIKRANRVYIPILDPEAHVTYYCACRMTDRKQLMPLFQEIAKQNQG